MATAAVERRSAALPDHLRRWNWGAFFFSWIWAFWHRAWLLGVLGLIPFVSLIVQIYLGVKGNEIAWRNKSWAGEEDFQASQRRWAIAALVVFVLSVALVILGAAMG
jgi:hypothetical protein